MSGGQTEAQPDITGEEALGKGLSAYSSSNTLSSLTHATNHQLKLLASNYARAIEQANSNSKAKRVDALLTDWHSRRDLEVQQFRQCAQMLERQLKEKQNTTQFYMGVTITEDSLIETKAKKGKPCFYRILLGASHEEQKRFGSLAAAGGDSLSGAGSGAGEEGSSSSGVGGGGLSASMSSLQTTTAISNTNWLYTTRLEFDTDGKVEVWISDSNPYFYRKHASSSNISSNSSSSSSLTSSSSSSSSASGGISTGSGLGASLLSDQLNSSSQLGTSSSSSTGGGLGGLSSSESGGVSSSSANNQGVISHFLTSSRHRTETISMRPAGPLYISIHPHSDLRALRLKVTIQMTLGPSNSSSLNKMSSDSSSLSRNRGFGAKHQGRTAEGNAASHSSSLTSFSSHQSSMSKQKDLGAADILSSLLAEGVGGKNPSGGSSGEGGSFRSGMGRGSASMSKGGSGDGRNYGSLSAETGSAVHRSVAKKLNLLRGNEALFSAFQERVDDLKKELKRKHARKMQLQALSATGEELQISSQMNVKKGEIAQLSLPHIPGVSAKPQGKTQDSLLVERTADYEITPRGEWTGVSQEGHEAVTEDAPLLLPLYHAAPALVREWGKNRDPLSPEELLLLRRAQGALERERIAQAKQRAELLLEKRKNHIEQSVREREEYRERVAEERRQMAHQQLQSNWLTTISLVKSANWILHEAAALPHRRCAEAALSEYLAKAEASRRSERARSHVQHLTSVVRFLAYSVAITRRDRAADIIRNFLEERTKNANDAQDFLAQGIARFHRRFQIVRRCVTRWVCSRITKRSLISLQWRRFEEDNADKFVRPVSEESLSMVLTEGLRQLTKELKEYVISAVRGRHLAGGIQAKPEVNTQIFMIVKGEPRLRSLLPKPLLSIWIARGHELDDQFGRVQPPFSKMQGFSNGPTNGSRPGSSSSLSSTSSSSSNGIISTSMSTISGERSSGSLGMTKKRLSSVLPSGSGISRLHSVAHHARYTSMNASTTASTSTSAESTASNASNTTNMSNAVEGSV